MTQSSEFLITALSLVHKEYFEDKILIWVFNKIKDYHQDYGTKTTKFVLLNELKKSTLAGQVKDSDVHSYMDVINDLSTPVNEQQYITAEVVRFCRRQEVRRAMIELAPLTDSQDDDVWSEIDSRIRAACSVGEQAVDVGTQFFIDYPERLHARMMGEDGTVIPVGIPDLDDFLNGGLKAGQIGIWMGGTGTGKSIALPQCAKRAVVAGYKVVHYTLELNEEETAARYDASFSTVPIHELRDQTTRVDDKLRFWQSMYGNSLIIKEYPTGTATVNTLRQHLISLKSIGFIPDLIVVDYGDLLKPQTNYNDEYADLGAIFKDLRGLAGEMKVPLWTATQINRSGISLEVADVDSIGDSFKKAQIADVIIAICATKEELESNILRLFIAKNRNGPPKRTVAIRSDYKRMCFYNPFGAPVSRAPTAAASSSPPPSGGPPGLPTPRRAPRRQT